MKKKEERYEWYAQREQALADEVKTLKQQNTLYIMGELLTFSFAVMSMVAYAVWDAGKIMWLLALVLLGTYLAIRHFDVRHSQRIDECERLQQVYQRELAYLSGDYSGFANGEEYVDASHPFSFDMDIFGRNSLFNRINRTITSGGSDWLAAELSKTGLRSADAILHRREALAELAEQETLRMAFMAQRQSKLIDTEKIRRVLDEAKAVRVPRFAVHTIPLILAVCVAVGLLFCIAGAIWGPLDGNAPVIWAVIQFFIVLAVCARPLKLISGIIGKINNHLQSYVSLITLIAEGDLKSVENAAIRQQLTAGDAQALASFRELKHILDGLDRRGNVLGLVLFNIFLLSDFFLVRRFLKWQDRYLLKMTEWVEAVSHFDALVSMATFQYNEPQATAAELSDVDGVFFEAHGLYHPFLGEEAVKNDFQITDAHYDIITGANMAGKSTFLRAIGINAILAMCGLPVFADQLRLSLFTLFSSMRTSDDLTRGISYFNAELLRLQQLMAYCRNNRHTLIILDEILKGTNSLDKLNGSRLFLQTVAQMPVTGVIATHDLELSKMENDAPDRFSNYCFEITLADDIIYSYKISRGVARNQNATYLLERMIEKEIN